jgi:hypothetical protein
MGRKIFNKLLPSPNINRLSKYIDVFSSRLYLCINLLYNHVISYNLIVVVLLYLFFVFLCAASVIGLLAVDIAH